MNNINVDELIDKINILISDIRRLVKDRRESNLNISYEDVLNIVEKVESLTSIKCNTSGYLNINALYEELNGFVKYAKNMTNKNSSNNNNRRMVNKFKEIMISYTINKDKEWKRKVRKEITMRLGKPVLTKEMIRDMKKYANPLEQLILLITRCFPTLLDDLGKLKDKRDKERIEYSMQEVTLIRLLALCCGVQSMAGIMAKLNKEEFIKNINEILETDLKKFPCDDTISNIINSLEKEELEKMQSYMIKRLIESKTFDKYRLPNGSFYVVLDGSGLYSTKKDLGSECITKTHNKKTENEYTEYQRYVLEAKLICGDYVFSFATEFVENASINNEQEKQDCELKAAYRLLTKIRKTYPKLSITIGGDALYVNKPFMDACKNEYHMDYILRYKNSVITTLYEEFIKIEKEKVEEIENDIKKEYEYVNEIGYGSGTKKTEGKTNIISFKDKESTFMYVTSFKIDKSNYREISIFGRRRWKIENQGFKSQKSEVLNIEHIYTFDNNGTKVNYLFIQLAHTLMTLLYYGSSIIKKLKETKVEVANLLYLSLIHEQELKLENSIQIRFD
jgi:hypothetical protein